MLTMVSKLFQMMVNLSCLWLVLQSMTQPALECRILPRVDHVGLGLMIRFPQINRPGLTNLTPLRRGVNNR